MEWEGVRGAFVGGMGAAGSKLVGALRMETTGESIRTSRRSVTRVSCY